MRRLQRRAATILCFAAVACVSGKSSSGAEVTRDPFLFGGTSESAASWSGVLIGILWDATSPLAMVGDHTVHVGSELGPWTVAEIQQDGIVLQLGERREIVHIGDRLPSN